MTSIKEIWKKYKEDRATTEEKEKLLKAIKNKDADLENILVENWRSKEQAPLDPGEMQKAWEGISSELGFNGKKRGNYFRYAVAAGIAVIVSLGILFYTSSDPMIQVNVAAGGEIVEVALPDGSNVWINSGSSISYPREFTSDQRSVSLSGNAFFEVQKDSSKPFIITSEDLTVKVLGTSFDVYSFRGEPASVSVKTGKVEVMHSGSDSRMILAKNERSRYDDLQGVLVKSEFDPELSLSWLDNVLHFENLQLAQIIKQLERKFGVQIECSDTDLLKSRVRASYNNEPLDSILNDLAFITDFQYDVDKQNNQITLKPNVYDKVE